MKRLLTFSHLFLSVACYSQCHLTLTFHTDTIELWPRKEFYFLEPIQKDYIVTNWKSDKTRLVNANFFEIQSYYFDTFLKPKKFHGLVVSDKNGGYFRLSSFQLYYYSSIKKREVRLRSTNVRHHGEAYWGYTDFYNPNEGLKLCYDSANQHVLVQVEPRLRGLFFGQKRHEKSPYKDKSLIFAMNAKGKIKGRFGIYDSIYWNKVMREAARFYVFLNVVKGELLITQKASSKLQVWDLKTQKLMRIVDLSTVNMRGSLSNYLKLMQDSTYEMKLKVLIESPSFGDVFYSKTNKHYYVLRSDSICDNTWQKKESVFYVNKVSAIKTKKRKRGCEPFTQQFYDQLKLYRKPTFIQVYDEHFRFIKEYEAPFPSKLRFLKEEENRIYLYHPSIPKLLFSFEELP